MRIRLIVACCAAVLLLGGLGTNAAWNSAAPMEDDSISSGTLSMTVGDDSTQTHQYTFSGLNVSNMSPGDRRQAPLTVRNAGDVPMGFTLATSSATGALADTLLLRVDVADDAKACPAGGDFDGTPSSLVYEGKLSAVHATAARNLDPAGSQVLCFAVVLPEDAPESLHGKSTTAVMTLRAESRSGA